jgi:BMFP domain-containing protein YqiC
MRVPYREVVMPRSELRTASCYPSAEEINALPEKFRQYIHDLVSRCDKSGDVQTIAILREDRDALQKRVEELEAELSRLRTQLAPSSE